VMNNKELIAVISNLAAVVRVQNGNRHADITEMLDAADAAIGDLLAACTDTENSERLLWLLERVGYHRHGPYLPCGNPRKLDIAESIKNIDEAMAK